MFTLVSVGARVRQRPAMSLVVRRGCHAVRHSDGGDRQSHNGCNRGGLQQPGILAGPITLDKA